MTTIVVSAGLLLILVVAVIAAIRRRYRLLWGRLFLLEERLRTAEKKDLDLEKQIIILENRHRMRLPPRLPSQHGEDVLLWRFFRRTTGLFVDVGAYDGVEFSNTYFLEAMGWTGILVEPNPEHASRCRNNRPYSRTVQAAVTDTPRTTIPFELVTGPGGVDTLSTATPGESHLERIRREGGLVHTIEVPAVTLNDLLEGTEQIDLLNLDIEGGELSALNSLDLNRIRPRVLLIEDNSCSLDEPVRNYLRKYGYVTRSRLEQNEFFTEEGDRGSF